MCTEALLDLILFDGTGRRMNTSITPQEHQARFVSSAYEEHRTRGCCGAAFTAATLSGLLTLRLYGVMTTAL